MFIKIYFADSAKWTDFTKGQLLEVCNDLGSCWSDLGEKLGLKSKTLDNIDNDYTLDKDKAKKMLSVWMGWKGNSATGKCLIDALEKIGKRDIAQKLSGSYVIFSLLNPD